MLAILPPTRAVCIEVFGDREPWSKHVRLCFHLTKSVVEQQILHRFHCNMMKQHFLHY